MFKEKFKERFDITARIPYSDISDDDSVDCYLFNEIQKIYLEDRVKFDKLKDFVFSLDEETLDIIFTKGIICYLEEDYKNSFRCFLTSVNLAPYNIDLWIYLTHSLKNIDYELGMELFFNLVYFYQNYNKFKLGILDLEKLKFLSYIVNNNYSSRNDYFNEPNFEDGYLINLHGCNNNCKFCPFKKVTNGDLFFTEDLLKQKLKKFHLKRIVLIGKEPTLYKNFFSNLKYISVNRPDIDLVIETNARMFSIRREAFKLSWLGNKNILVTVKFYSFDESLHDNLTKIKGSYIQTVEGIKNLIFTGNRTRLELIVNSQNHQNIYDTILEAFKELDTSVYFKGLFLTISSDFMFSHKRDFLSFYENFVSKLVLERDARVYEVIAELIKTYSLPYSYFKRDFESGILS